MTSSPAGLHPQSPLAPTTLDAILAAASAFDRSTLVDRLAAAEAERREILTRFPKEGWPSMTLERYALGQSDSEDTYSRWVEFKSNELGSISGGSAMKMVIFKRRHQDGWYYPESRFPSLEEAWTTLRSSFVEAFRMADEGSWETTDYLPALEYGPSLRAKSLHIYYPKEILPIYGRETLRYFLRFFGHTEEETKPMHRVTLNRLLLSALRARPEFNGWSLNEIGFFLFDKFNPREVRRVFKIAPGEGAKYWSDCLAGQYMCVGWDKVGDLTDFKTKSDFRARFDQEYGATYDKKSKLSAKANEVWALRELEAGDVIIANQGISKVLAIGEVQDPGYKHREDRAEFQHTVRVNWDTDAARTIEPQPSWGTMTVAKVSSELFESILSTATDSSVVVGPGPKVPTIAITLDPELAELAETLERKGQLILYGPPGTGKTHTARRLAVAFLLRHSNADAAAILADPARSAQAEKTLAERTAPDALAAVLTRLTFHPSYAYEDFIEGFRPSDNGSGVLALRLDDGVFKRVCTEARRNSSAKYVVMIDEINRANLGKVFGEIITLLERDKRDLVVTLPQSKEEFSLPPNVYIIGTMNTADRSIKLMDAALRRRFAFSEVMPDSELLRGAKIESLALDEFLDELNERISRDAGREKQIGHSFFLDGGKPITDPEDFARRFRQEILPLLQEYCYDEYSALANYLGSEIVDRDAGTIDSELIRDAASLISALEKEIRKTTTPQA